MRGHTGGLHCYSHSKGSDASVVNYEKSQTLFVRLKNHACGEKKNLSRRLLNCVLRRQRWTLSHRGCIWPAVKKRRKKAETRCVHLCNILVFIRLSHTVALGLVSGRDGRPDLPIKLQTLAFCLPASPSTPLKQLFAPLDKFVLLSPSESSDDLKCTYSSSASQRVLDWGFNLPN